MLDLLIYGGTVIDGSGKPGVKANLGVRDGRIVKIGDFEEEAAETIDATGLVVAPGFIDIHTHYDAQVFWDPTLSPSSNHGVTTVLAGNCGFSIAPLSGKAEDSDYLAAMLSRVEGMPLESLKAGVPWDWISFAEYLAKLDGKVMINMGFLVGHSALRRAVMGSRAVGEQASKDEITQMQSRCCGPRSRRAGRASPQASRPLTSMTTAIPCHRVTPPTRSCWAFAKSCVSSKAPTWNSCPGSADFSTRKLSSA